MKMVEIAVIYAKEIQETYSMVLNLNHPEPISKEIKLLEAFQSPIQMMGKKIKVVYPSGEIEFISEDAVDSLKNFMNNMAMTNKIPQIENAMAEMAANWNLHRQVLVDLGNKIAEMNKPKPSIWSRIYNWCLRRSPKPAEAGG